MFTLEFYTDKFAESGCRLIRKAYDEARSRDHNQITSEHFLISIAKIEEAFFIEVMQSLNLDPQVVVDALATKLSQNNYSGRGIKMSKSFRTLEVKALKRVREQGRRQIESEDMFIALFKDERSFPVKLFQQFGIDCQTVIQRIWDVMKESDDQLNKSQNQKLVFRVIQKQSRNEEWHTLSSDYPLQASISKQPHNEEGVCRIVLKRSKQ